MLVFVNYAQFNLAKNAEIMLLFFTLMYIW